MAAERSDPTPDESSLPRWPSVLSNTFVGTRRLLCVLRLPSGRRTRPFLGIPKPLVAERQSNKVVGLYRRGRLKDTGLDQQVREIDNKSAGLIAQILALESKLWDNGFQRGGAGERRSLLMRPRQWPEKPLTNAGTRAPVCRTVGGRYSDRTGTKRRETSTGEASGQGYRRQDRRRYRGRPLRTSSTIASVT